MREKDEKQENKRKRSERGVHTFAYAYNKTNEHTYV